MPTKSDLGRRRRTNSGILAVTFVGRAAKLKTLFIGIGHLNKIYELSIAHRDHDTGVAPKPVIRNPE